MRLALGKRREGDVAPPPASPLPSSEADDAPPPTSFAPFTAAMTESLSRATSAEDASPQAGASSPNSVYRFDIGKYKDGSFRFVPASARELVRYTGRVLHHGPTPARKTKVNTVQFDWSAVAFELRVSGARSVGIRLKGDGAFILFPRPTVGRRGLRVRRRAEPLRRRRRNMAMPRTEHIPFVKVDEHHKKVARVDIFLVVEGNAPGPVGRRWVGSDGGLDSCRQLFQRIRERRAELHPARVRERHVLPRWGQQRVWSRLLLSL